MSLYSLSINVHTISNPQYNDIICMLTNHFVWTMRWLRLRLHRLLECSRTIYSHWLYITTVHSQAGRCIYAYNTHIPIIDYLMQWPIHLHELPTDYINPWNGGQFESDFQAWEYIIVGSGLPGKVPKLRYQYGYLSFISQLLTSTHCDKILFRNIS